MPVHPADAYVDTPDRNRRHRDERLRLYLFMEAHNLSWEWPDYIHGSPGGGHVCDESSPCSRVPDRDGDLPSMLDFPVSNFSENVEYS
eukprot:9905537-Karenia_brevis.AAC.1